MTIDYYARKALRYEDDVLFCAGDVETDGLGGKLLMVQWGYFGNIYTASGPDMVKQFFDCMLDMPKPAIWFFHFGQYDWRYFLDYIEEQELLVEIGMRTDTDIYEIRVKRNKKDSWSIMRDSYALWSHKLEKLAESFCPEIPKLDIGLSEGYIIDPTNPKDIEYAKRDVEILLTGLPRLYDMIYKHFGVNPSATAAGTALKAWQKSLSKDEIYDAQEWGEKELFIRQGYYGGLVFLTSNLAHENCETYDINSSYPASMVDYGVPYGLASYTHDFEEDYPGIYRIRIKAPDNLIVPILPARNIHGSMRWYRGEFETTVTKQELEFAVMNGYELIDLFEGFYFEKTIFPFDDFITQCKLIRKAFKNQTEEQVAKLMQNSLYGKFGSRRDRVKLINANIVDQEELIGCREFDEHGNWYTKTELDEAMRCIPQWASFITANSRLRLLRAVYDIGPANVIYGDTDSITIKANCAHDRLDIGSNYGQWKLEKEWQIFKAIAPKVYAGVLGADIGTQFKKGDYLGAAKGLPRKGVGEKQWRELLECGSTSAEAKSLASLKVAIAKGVKPATDLIRQSSTLTNSMNFDALQNGDVRVKFAHG